MSFTPGAGAVISFSVDGAQSAQRQIESVGSSMQGLSATARDSLKDLAAFAGVGLSLGALAEKVLGAQREFDKLNASLVTATGSVADAAAAFKTLQAFAASTPYGVADATEAFIKMKNLGLDPSEKALRSYGNTAAAMGKGLDQMIEAVADAATGEFERLKEFGITSKQTGDKVALTFKGMTTVIGKNADEIQAYLKKIGDTDFAGAMALRAETLDGAISNLGDSWDAFLLKMSQSGLGDAAKNGVIMLADNLQLLAGVIGTVAAARLGSAFASWTTETYKQVAASVALRAATVAEMEAEVAGTAAKVGQLGTTQAMIVVAREEAMSKLASANSNIAAAETAIAAATAAGAQSFALRTVRLATAELTVAEAARSAMLAELAVLGRQQASVSAQLAAARLAEKAAQDALNASTAAGTLASGAARSALGLLGGPVGAIITVLGLAATAWSVWGRSAEDSTKQAAESYEAAHKRIVKGLDEQIAKNTKLVQLQNLGMTKPQIDRNQPVLEQLAAASKRLNDINNRTGEFAPGAGKSNTDVLFERLKVMQHITELAAKMKTNDERAAQAATGSTEAMIAVRQRLTGVNQQYLDDLEKLQAAYEKGEVKLPEYTAAVSKLATETFKNSTAGQNSVAAIDATIAAMKRRDQVADLVTQRELARIAAQKDAGEISEAEAIDATAKAELSALGRKQTLLGQELALTKKKSDTAKEQADLEGQIAVVGEQRRNREQQQHNDILALQRKRTQASQELYTAGILAATAERDNLVAALGTQLDYNAVAGLTKLELAEVQAARMQNAAAMKEETAAALEATDAGNPLVALYREQAQARRDIASAIIDGAAKDASQELKDFLDPARAQTFGEALRTAFGTAGDSLTKLTGALQQFGARQKEIEKQRGAAAWSYLNGKKTEEEYVADIAALNEQSVQSQMAGYGDMASAAAGFFGEHSRGYQSMMAVSQAFHAAELALTTAELVPKAISAVLTQGQGDPYTAFGRMAAMAALVAGLGVAIGGIGGGADTVAKDRQAAQGSGSVLGDKDAKSESIKKSLGLIEKNTYQDLAISSSMLATLRSIDSNISSFASQLVRTADITNPDIALGNGVSGANMGSVALASAGFAAGSMVTLIGDIMGPVGALAGLALSKIPVVQKLMTSIFGGKQSVSDSGFGMDPASLASILASGAHAYQYADIKTSGGWFSSDKHSEQTNPLGDAANRQFTAIITSLADSIKTAGGMLGLAGDDFTSKLNSFVIDIGHVSLKDLKGDDLQKALEAVFSRLGDDMAQYAVGGLQELQQVGEGYLETLARVASEYQTIEVVFQSFGKTFDAVGLASVAARDRLVQLAGGLDKFTSQGEYFLQNFFSEKEQAAALKARIDPTLAQYGLSSTGENASRMFRDFIVGLDTTSEEGAKAYTVLMAMAPALKQVADSEKAAFDERKELQDQLDEMTMTSTQLLAKQRAALDESNRALFDQVQAIKAVKDAAGTMFAGVGDAFSALQRVVDREKAAVQASVTAQTAAVTKLQGLSQALHGALDSYATPAQAGADRASAQAQIRTALAIAKAGGVLPDAEGLKKALSTVTQNSANQFRTYEEYLADRNQTKSDLAQLAGITDDSLTVEQRSLNALQDQLSRLDAIVANGQAQLDELKGASVANLTLAQAVAALSSSIASAKTNTVVAGTSSIADLYQTLLGRAPDQAGLQYWQDALARGNSLDAIRSGFMESDEYKKLHPFAVGTNYVPETMPALIHEGERIIPAADNRALMARLSSPAANADALAAAVERLTATVDRQQRVIEEQSRVLEQTQRNTKRLADDFQRVTRGGDKMVTTTEK